MRDSNTVSSENDDDEERGTLDRVVNVVLELLGLF
jgi:hypothetical protein